MVSRDDLINEAGQTTEGWSPDVSSAVKRGLTMLNGAVPDDIDIRPQWRKPAHVSAAAAADAGAKIVPLVRDAQSEVELELLGLTPDQVQRVMADKRRNRGGGALNDIRTRLGVDPDAPAV